MSRLARNPEVVCTELEDGAVLLNMETRLYFSLNDVGLELWNLLDGTRDSQQLAQELASGFESDEAAVRDPVSRFLDELERERLVVASTTAEPSPSPGSPPPGPADERGPKRRFAEPELIKHDEPLHEVSTSPFDPQLPLAE